MDGRPGAGEEVRVGAGGLADEVEEDRQGLGCGDAAVKSRDGAGTVVERSGAGLDEIDHVVADAVFAEAFEGASDEGARRGVRGVEAEDLGRHAVRAAGGVAQNPFVEDDERRAVGVAVNGVAEFVEALAEGRADEERGDPQAEAEAAPFALVDEPGASVREGARVPALPVAEVPARYVGVADPQVAEAVSGQTPRDGVEVGEGRLLGSLVRPRAARPRTASNAKRRDIVEDRAKTGCGEVGPFLQLREGGTADGEGESFEGGRRSRRERPAAEVAPGAEFAYGAGARPCADRHQAAEGDEARLEGEGAVGCRELDVRLALAGCVGRVDGEDLPGGLSVKHRDGQDADAGVAGEGVGRGAQDRRATQPQRDCAAVGDFRLDEEAAVSRRCAPAPGEAVAEVKSEASVRLRRHRAQRALGAVRLQRRHPAREDARNGKPAVAPDDRHCRFRIVFRVTHGDEVVEAYWTERVVAAGGKSW